MFSFLSSMHSFSNNFNNLMKHNMYNFVFHKYSTFTSLNIIYSFSSIACLCFCDYNLFCALLNMINILCISPYYHFLFLCALYVACAYFSRCQLVSLPTFDALLVIVMYMWWYKSINAVKSKGIFFVQKLYCCSLHFVCYD